MLQYDYSYWQYRILKCLTRCYVGSRIVRHICALVLPTVPLSLSPSTGDLVFDWDAFVGWPSPIKDAHFTFHRSLSPFSFQPHPVPASGRAYLGHAARRSAGARFILVCCCWSFWTRSTRLGLVKVTLSLYVYCRAGGVWWWVFGTL